MRWGADRRLDWIDDRLTSGGTFRRADIVDYFGITPQQASSDIGTFAKSDPAFAYDRHQKLFRREQGGQSVRYSTPLRRSAWNAWPRGQSWCPDAEDHRPGVVCWECQR
jgi:hypothetical protein